MKTNQIGKFIVALVATVAGVGCGPSSVIVKQANPNPFQGKKTFAVEAPSYEGMLVGNKLTEAEWIEKRFDKKPAEEKEKFKTDFQAEKDAAGAMFVATLTSELKGAAIEVGAGDSIKSKVTMMERGFWSPAGWGTINTQINLTVNLADQDEVNFTCMVQPGMFNPAPGGNEKTCMDILGKSVAQYVKQRTGAVK